ncbi:MAG: hypothetical protein QOD65_3031, partial [Gaiellales bacterium]|nr:hypothetical protein [Gaiellales bacterium]
APVANCFVGSYKASVIYGHSA